MTKRRINISISGLIEPIYEKIKKESDSFRSDFHYAMNYVRSEKNAADLKKEVIKYVKVHNKDKLAVVRQVDEDKCVVLGKLCYLLNRGSDIPEDFSEKLPEMLNNIYELPVKLANANSSAIATAKTVRVKRTTIQDRIQEKAKEAAGEIEGWIDDFITANKNKDLVKTTQDFVNLFKQYELKLPHLKIIKASFARIKGELDAILNQDDNDGKEYYSNFTRPELKRLLSIYENLYESIGTISSSASLTRKPRTRKPVNIEQLVSKVKYKKEDTVLQLTSTHPRNIPGSTSVWVFNTKTRKLGCYKAADESGLNVKGTTIINFSVDSVEKTLRRPKDVLTELPKVGKVKLRTFLTTVETVETKLKGRLNEDIIILKVDK